MARPTKQGINYFPLDTQFDDKIEMFIIEKEAIGLSVLITIWQMIYSNEGYYTTNGNDLFLLVKKRINVGINEIDECINICLNRGIFDKKLHDKYKILTSKAIQKRYFEAAKRKKEVHYKPEYILLKSIKEYTNLVNVNINPVNDIHLSTNVKVNVKEKVNVKVKEDNAVLKSETALKSQIVKEAHTRAIEIFCNYYELKTGLKYNFIGKDAKQIQILLKRLIKIFTKDLTAENLLSGLQYFLNNIKDDWILNNLSIGTVNSKFNEILNQMKNGIRKTNGRGFESDSPEKWERIFSAIATGSL